MRLDPERGMPMTKIGAAAVLPRRDERCRNGSSKCRSNGVDRQILKSLLNARNACKTIVDFNLAWNPLCAYSDGYNCPLAPPENRLDREAALRLYTAGSAALTGESDVKGILKEGYYGDLAILSDDYFSVEEADISHIESVLTVVGGNIVYSAGPYEQVAAPSPEITIVLRAAGVPL